jgi:transcriptional regulator with GAF, ATPase, and Fis domain
MPEQTTEERLAGLRARLEQINRLWTVDSHEGMLAFFVTLLPRALGAERCTVFFVEPGGERIWSLFGTGLQRRQIEAPRQDSVVGRTIASGEPQIENDLQERDGFHVRADERTGFVTRNLVCVPITSRAGRGVIGAVQVLNKRGAGGFDAADAGLLEDAASSLSMAMDNLLLNQEVLVLSGRLEQEVEALRGEDHAFIADSPAMRAVLEQVRTLAEVPVNVLVSGENGTGKEIIARRIHAGSERAGRPLVTVNCAAIPEHLMESEFFGYEKGAFTGAVGSKPGRFEEADGGILFLDEVGELPLSLQPKFLRVLQDGEGRRLGGTQPRRYDLRLISATNRDLRADVASGRFREDLYYRLFAVELRLPPLRERREDIVPMALAFLDQTSKRFGKYVAGFASELPALFEAYTWPGNVRQLRREIERLVALTPPGEPLRPTACSAELQELAATSGGALGVAAQGDTLPERVRALEMALIRQALAESGGNRARAAAVLGITRQGLHKKLKRFQMDT